MRLLILTLISIFLFSLPSKAQTGPQGQNGRWVWWGVVQVDQKISSKWTSTTIFGYSRRSDFRTAAPDRSVNYFGVWGLRQEFSRPAGKAFRLSIGAFYSLIGTGGESSDPDFYMNEIRFYPRVYYDLLLKKKQKITFQFRTDFRYLYSTGLPINREALEVRQRLAFQYSVPLDKKEIYTFLPTVEFFAGTVFQASDWSTYRWTETRARMFLRIRLSKKLYLDPGMMIRHLRDLPAGGTSHFSGYLALGLVVKNPFK